MKKSFLAIFLAFSPAIFALPITITFANLPLTAPAGATLSVSGSLANTVFSEQFLNSVNISGLTPLMLLDSNPFFDVITGAPISLAASSGAGSSVSGISFFNVAIDSLVLPGSYSGTMTIIGGANGAAMDIIGTSTFTVEVTAATPEPATWAMLGIGLAIIAARGKKLNTTACTPSFETTLSSPLVGGA